MSNAPSTTILERILAATRADLAERRAAMPLAEVQALAAAAPAPRPFAAALRPAAGAPARLLAEVKRASPSRGLLAETYDPVALARAYVAGGAAAISVLTEPHFFLGALEHLRAVRAAVPVPVLRKDFVVDPYQVYEARAAGADAVLLLCAALDDAALAELLALARNLGMEALVEAHDAAELRRALACGATVLGANSRDLRTFGMEEGTVRLLRPLVPAERIFVAESGILSRVDAARARAFGADALLVGEALMRAAQPGEMARALATAPGGATAALMGTVPWVKICGLATAAQAQAAAQAGADAIGLVFAHSTRRIAPEEAAALVRACTAAEGARRPRAVGVFVNERVEVIIALARTVGLDAIQLSGDEPPEACAAVAAATGLPVLKALRPRTTDDLAALDDYALAGATLLLDTPRDGVYGGTGQVGDWALASVAARRWPIILSGGLTPENVGAALQAVPARGVDVSSGVETARTKDVEKIRRFVAAARQAAQQEQEQPL